MATIIVQGTKEENAKAITALRDQFPTVKKQSETTTANGNLTVLDIFLDVPNGREFTDQEIAFAMQCCTNKDKDCKSCPFKKTEKCKETLFLEGSLYVQRLFRRQDRNDNT